MDTFLHIHKTFDKVIYANQTVNNREFDGCVFNNCDFTGSDFSNNTFSDCEFIDCNMSNINLQGSGLKTVAFKTCKLLGVEFDKCEDFLFRVSFDNCILDYASFINKKMPKTHFDNCSLREVTFSGSNLTAALFNKCNLEHALFNDSELKQADFRTAYNYTIDPEFNSMKKAMFSMHGIEGLLSKYDIRIV